MTSAIPSEIHRDLAFHAARLGIDSVADFHTLIDRLTRRSPPSRAETWRYRPLTLTEQQARARQIIEVLDDRLARYGTHLPDTEASLGLRAALVLGDDAALNGTGITVEYAWADDIMRAAIGGGTHLWLETFGPYIDGHVEDSVRLGPLDEGRLPSDERVGLQLMAMFSDLTAGFGNVTLTSLIDDRVGESVQHDEMSLAFLLAVTQLLEEHGIIRDHEADLGDRVVLMLESDLEPEVAKLVSLLDASGDGTILTSGNGDVTYLPGSDAIRRLALHSRNRNREFARRGISIVRDGAPTCHALDAASHLDPNCGSGFRVVVLDKRFGPEQDRVYALLRGAGLLGQRNSHPIFFDSALLDPASILYGMAALLRRHAGEIAGELSRFDSWTDQDPVEYVERNYGRGILPEDRQLIGFVIDRLDASGIAPGSLTTVADVGAGPNLYPALMLAPYLAPHGVIDLIEPSDRCRGCVRSMLRNRDRRIWSPFAARMDELSCHPYHDALDRVFDQSHCIDGSINGLPSARYQVVCSFFSTESITSSRAEFRAAIDHLVGAVRPGGLLITAHMLRSEGWHAGEGTTFPAVAVQPCDLDEAYRDADCDFEVSVVEHPTDGAVVRAGYDGMAVVVARPRVEVARRVLAPEPPTGSPFAVRMQGNGGRILTPLAG